MNKEQSAAMVIADYALDIANMMKLTNGQLLSAMCSAYVSTGFSVKAEDATAESMRDALIENAAKAASSIVKNWEEINEAANEEA